MGWEKAGQAAAALLAVLNPHAPLTMSGIYVGLFHSKHLPQEEKKEEKVELKTYVVLPGGGGREDALF